MTMLGQLRQLYHWCLGYKRKAYLDSLIRKGLILGRDVVIMDGCFLDPSHCFLISIDDGTVLAPCVRLIAHDASMKRALGYTKVGRITIGKKCFIGDSAVVLPGVNIGEDSIIGAGSIVIRDIPAHCVAAGNPCRVIGQKEELMQKYKKEIVSRKTPFADKRSKNLTDIEKAQLLASLNSGAGYIR